MPEQEKSCAAKRRTVILERLRASAVPCSASLLARACGVSRQVIVGDVAILRASGEPIIATPRGYRLQNDIGFCARIACCHQTMDALRRELYIVVDLGGVLVDVLVEHPLYGELVGQLEIASRFDADRFVEAISCERVEPLSRLTGGIHLHTIRCDDSAAFERIEAALEAAGLLLPNE